MIGLILVLLSEQGKKDVIRAYKDLILNFKGHWFTVCSHTGIDGNKGDGAWRKVKSRISDNPGPCHDILWRNLMRDINQSYFWTYPQNCCFYTAHIVILKTEICCKCNQRHNYLLSLCIAVQH